MRAKVEIVFRRKVRAIWLEQGSLVPSPRRAFHGQKPSPVLAKEIAAENSGTVTISKVLEHIRRIWFEPPDDCARFASRCLAATIQTPMRFTGHDTKLLLNWGMTIAAYPFVGSAGEALGRLLKLQNEARRADVQRRLREQYGDRDFVNRITRYTVSSFLDWGVIVETKPKGIYLVPANKSKPRNRPSNLAWLARGGSDFTRQDANGIVRTLQSSRSISLCFGQTQCRCLATQPAPAR